MTNTNHEGGVSLHWDRFLLENIILHMPNLAFWKDTNSVYMGCNANYAHLVGLRSPSEIIGKTDYDLGWLSEGHSAEFFRQKDKAILEGKEIINLEQTLASSTGQKITVLLNKVPLRDPNGKIFGILGLSTDITELKRSQENEKKALEKSAADEAMKHALLIFSGMSTHDLRTPLSSISLRAAFLKKYIPSLIEGYELAAQTSPSLPHIRTKVLSDLPSAPRDILQAVEEANEYIDASLKSLRGASQGIEFMDDKQLVNCNAERLLRRIIDSYPYQQNQQSLIHCDYSYDFNFQGNIIFFNRLVENLIKNAFEQIEAKGKGEIFITCAAGQKLNLIKIKDTAGGVTHTVIDALFNGIQTTKTSGTGIGLSSAKQIMQAMKGEISAHLVEGDCIEFVLSFPKPHPLKSAKDGPIAHHD